MHIKEDMNMDLFKWLTEEHDDQIACTRVGNMVEVTTKRGSVNFELKDGENYYDKVLEVLKAEIKKIKNPQGKLVSLDEETCYGPTGKKTNMKDVYGETLYTGDVVSVYGGKNGEVQTFVTQDFLMGYKSVSSKMVNGLIDKTYIVAKRKSYKELSHNEAYGRLKYYEED